MRPLFEEDQSAPLLPGWEEEWKRHLAMLVWLQALSSLIFVCLILKTIYDMIGKHVRQMQPGIQSSVKAGRRVGVRFC